MKSRREILKSSRNKKKTRVWIRRPIFYVIILVFIFILVWLVAWQSGNSKITINKVVISGGSTIYDERILKYARKELAGKYFGLFNKDNAFIYPKKQLENKILEQYKRILDVNIYADGMNSIIINVSERIPKYIYCGENIPESDSEIGQCYFLDSTGYIFSKAPYFSGDVFFKFYGSVKDVNDSPIGSYFLDKQDFKKTNLLREGIDGLGIPLVMFEIKTEGDYVFYMKEGGKILFNKNQEYGGVLDNLDSALKDILSLNKKINYIDLRFGNKVFYKFVK